jgi:hypothetical protein
VFCVRRIQALLQLIQAVAMALSTGSTRGAPRRKWQRQLDQRQREQQRAPEQGIEHQQGKGNDAPHDRGQE